MLIEDELLYQKVAETLGRIAIKVHAIYAPEEAGAYGAEAYSAAVDLFEPGMTYRVFFSVDQGQVKVKHLERWFMG